MEKKVALVSGGNRGLGWEVCRQLARAGIDVILGSRSPAEGARAAERLWKSDRLEVAPRTLDVRRPDSARAAVDFAIRRFGRLDILINNAGILLDGSADDVGDVPLLESRPQVFLASFETNALGPLRLCQAAAPRMLTRGHGRIVNVSSGDAQLARIEGGRAAYRVSKVALNAMTRILAAELAGTDVLVNAVNPGWLRTRMGGPRAPRAAQKGAETVVWLALLPPGGPQGGFFHDRRKIPW